MRRIMAGALVVAGLVALGGWTQTLQAEVGGSGNGYTDYDNYPPALPEDCPEGAGALAGVAFASSSGGAAGHLGGLTLAGGDTVTMSWDGAVDGCAGADGQPAVVITLASHKSAYADHFDVMEDQLLLDWVSCGAGSPCDVVDGRYQVQLRLPSGAVACQAQVDAVLGPPLGMVGPNGSYYTGGLRDKGGATTLIDAGRASSSVCEEPSTTPPGDDTTSFGPGPTPDESTTPPDAGTDEPTSTPSPEPTTTPDTTPTSSGGPTPGSGTDTTDTPETTDTPDTPASGQLVALPTTPAQTTSVGGALVSSGGGPVTVESATVAQPATSVLGITAGRADLPTTGAPTDEMVVIAAALIVVGAIVSTAASRTDRRRFAGSRAGA